MRLASWELYPWGPLAPARHIGFPPPAVVQSPRRWRWNTIRNPIVLLCSLIFSSLTREVRSRRRIAQMMSPRCYYSNKVQAGDQFLDSDAEQLVSHIPARE